MGQADKRESYEATPSCNKGSGRWLYTARQMLSASVFRGLADINHTGRSAATRIRRKAHAALSAYYPL